MATAKLSKRSIRGKQNREGLLLSHNRKVANIGTYQRNRRRWVAAIPNSFGLPSGVSCPGRTPFCDECYADGSENSQHVRENLEHNLALLQKASSVEAMEMLIVRMLSEYVRVANGHKIPEKDRIFRIHWDGDFFSLDYAQAWALAMARFPTVQFLAYTRSFRGAVNVVPILANVPNFELYLSADKWNIDEALELVDQYPQVHLALCAEDFERGRALSPDRPSRACPENAGILPLMGPISKDNPTGPGRGACVACKICFEGRGHIIFTTSHQERAGGSPEAVPVKIGPSRRPKAA